MSTEIKILNLTQEMAGRILIIRGDFRFADEIFGDAPATATAGPQQSVQPQASAPAPAASAPPGVEPSPFDVLPGEKSVDACLRWVKRFVLEDMEGSATMSEIRDAVPTSIQAFYSTMNSARSAVTTAAQKLVEDGVLDAPEGFGRKSALVAPAQTEARPEVVAETQVEAPPEPAPVTDQAPAATETPDTPDQAGSDTDEPQEAALTETGAEEAAQADHAVEEPAEEPRAIGAATTSEVGMLNADDFFNMESELGA